MSGRAVRRRNPTATVDRVTRRWVSALGCLSLGVLLAAVLLLARGADVADVVASSAPVSGSGVWSVTPEPLALPAELGERPSLHTDQQRIRSDASVAVLAALLAALVVLMRGQRVGAFGRSEARTAHLATGRGPPSRRA
jgi:hypothetical protein